MPQSLIRPLRFELLTNFEMLECSTLIVENALAPAKAQSVGMGKPYNDYVTAHTTFEKILKHNPALVETESLTGDVNNVRLLLGVFDSNLRAAGITGDAAVVEAVKEVSNIAAPYIKVRHTATMLALLAAAQDLCQALETAAVAPKVALLGLTEQVTVIKQLAQRGNALVIARGEEKEYRKKLGTSAQARTALQKQLRFLFTGVLPVIYHSTTDAVVKNKVIMMLDEVNATLDSFRHLTGGGTGSGNDDYGYSDPGVPDTGPATPPDDNYNGGTYIDPNA